MKKLLLPLFIGFLTISAQAQIANGGFENWTTVLLFEHPNTSFADMSSNYETYFDNGVLSVTKVQEADNTVMRIENVMGSEAVMPGYFIFGKTPTDGLVFGGGHAISDVSMTGISMDLKFDMLEGSEGFIVVQFKHENAPVGEGNHGTGTHVFPISGSEDWSNKEFEFDYPVDPTADRCVIGIASADLITNDMPYVIGSFIEVDNIAFIGSDDRISGGNFEGWNQVEPIMTPTDCVVDIHPFSPNYAQTAFANQGSFAVKLKTILEQEGDLSVGKLLMGNKDGNGEIIPTIEIGQNDMLSFAYSYSASNDLGQAKVVFYDEANYFAQVFDHSIELAPTAGYEMYEFPFGEMLQEMEITATHMSIEFKSSIETVEIQAKLGSTLLIDDVELQTPLGLMIFQSYRTIKTPLIRAYPNPTNGRVAFTFSAPRTGYYRVYDNNGTQIAIREFSSSKEVWFDLGPYSPGNYVFKFQHNSGTDVSRVVKY